MRAFPGLQAQTSAEEVQITDLQEQVPRVQGCKQSHTPKKSTLYVFIYMAFLRRSNLMICGSLELESERGFSAKNKGILGGQRTWPV